jgi:hypothetical protein
MGPTLISLYGLLEIERITPPVLAAAVKQHGVAGWDNYGTHGRFKKDSDAAKLALSEIEKYHRVIQEGRKTGENLTRKLPYMTGINPILQLGWFSGEVPDFKALQKSMGSQPEYEFSKTRPETEWAIIGGLLHALLGKTGSRPHPDFKTQQQVIDFLIDEYKDLKLSGISKTSLENKFSAANAYLSKKKN